MFKKLSCNIYFCGEVTPFLKYYIYIYILIDESLSFSLSLSLSYYFYKFIHCLF